MPGTGGNNSVIDEEILPLELEDDAEGDFLVAENPRFSVSSSTRRHSSFVREEREFATIGRKSFDVRQSPLMAEKRRVAALPPPALSKEKEYVKSLRPSVWLTEQFPLKTEELLPLLDILANKVKAVRRLREVLTTKFPPGTFPVKVTIPVLPAVRVVVTFSKFVELQPLEQFYTPVSSPANLLEAEEDTEDDLRQPHKSQLPKANNPASSWLRRTNSHLGSKKTQSYIEEADEADPFSIPINYAWASIEEEKVPKRKNSISSKKGR